MSRDGNYDPRAFEPQPHDWAGQYFAFDPKVAEGYGTDYFDENILKSKYYRNQLRIGRDMYAVEVTKPIYADSTIIGDLKAKKIKWFLSNRGLGRYFDQNDKKSFTREEFRQISNSVKKTFANRNMFLMNGLDQSHLGMIHPHDNEGNKELILHSKTLGSLYVARNPIGVEDDGREIKILSKKKLKKGKKPKKKPDDDLEEKEKKILFFYFI